MKAESNIGIRLFLLIFIALALFTYFSTSTYAMSTATPVYFNVNVPTVITNIATNPILPLINNATEEIIEVNFTSNDYVMNLTFNIYNEIGNLISSQGPIEITSELELPVNFTIPSNLEDGEYVVNISVINKANIESIYEVGNFTVENPDINPPEITNIETIPESPFTNNGFEQNVTINFTSNEYPINVTFNIYNETGDLIYSEATLQINNLTELPVNFTIPINLDEGNYTINMSATDASNNTRTINIAEFIVEHALPEILELNISPYVGLNNSNVSIRVNTLYEETIIAEIEKPNGVFENLTLLNNQSINFTNTSLLGRYNLTIYVNNTFGTTTLIDHFEIFDTFNFNFTVIDSNLTGVNSSWDLIYRDDIIVQNRSENGTYLVSTLNLTGDLNFKAYNNKLDVLLKDVKLIQENGKLFGMDKLQTPLSGYKISYGINNSFNFSQAKVKIYYDDITFTNENNLKLEKCNDWLFEQQICNGSFVDITPSSAQNTIENYFEYNTTSFSGFSIKEISSSSNTGEDLGGSAGTTTYTTCTPLWSCSFWTECIDGIKTRVCTDTNCNGKYEDYIEQQNCSCEEDWLCDEWSTCIDGIKTRGCYDLNNCSTINTKPITQENCTFEIIEIIEPTEVKETNKLPICMCAYEDNTPEFWICTIIIAIITFILEMLFIHRKNEEELI